MATIMRRRWIGAVGLLVAICPGVAGAQTGESDTRTHYLNCGPFTLTAGDTAQVHASLDDLRDGRPARVTLQLYDAAGAVRAQKDVVLQAGQMTTLAWTLVTPASELFRVHIEIKEAALPVSARRRGMAFVEVLDLVAKIKPVCIPDDGVKPPPQ